MQSEFIALTNHGLELHNAVLDTAGELKVDKIRCIEGVEEAEWSPKGDVVALVRKGSLQNLEVYDANTWEVLYTVEGPSPVTKFSFSPLGNYLLVCCRFDATQYPENLRVIETKTAKEITRLPQRGVNELSWPPLRWTGAESFMCRLVKGAVHIFSKEQLESGNFNINTPLLRIPSPRATAVFASPESTRTNNNNSNSSSSSNNNNNSNNNTPTAYCAIFSKEIKGEPGILEVYELRKEEYLLIIKKSFYYSQEGDCLFAYDGRAVLFKTHTDATDHTYYGSSALYFIKCQGGYDVRLVAAEEGPVHAAAWSPSTIEFAICYGKVPANVSLYDGNSKCTSPKYKLGEGMRTNIYYCPFSRLLLWGGFGNLAGEIEIWSPRKKGILAKTISPSAICQWSSCGCFFVTANIYPRLRVDNRINFFSLSGDLLHRLEFSCLYNIKFRPLLPSSAAAAAAAAAQKEIIDKLTVYTPGNCPLAKGAESNKISPTGRSLSALTQSKLGASASSSGVYRPPGVRNAATKLPPGAAEPPSSSSSKSSRKRNKKNKGDNVAEGAAAAAPADNGAAAADGATAEPAATAAAAPAAAAAAADTPKNKNNNSSPSSSPTADSKTDTPTQDPKEELRKMIRGMKKKLTEIQRLKEKKELDDLQKEKIKNEEKIRKELSILEDKFNSLNI